MKNLPRSLFCVTAVVLLAFVFVEHGARLPTLALPGSLHYDAAEPTARGPSAETGADGVASNREEDAGSRERLAFEQGRLAGMNEIEQKNPENKIKGIFMIFVSGVLLLCSIAVVMLKRYDANQKHWSYATLGTIVGFWLR